MDTWEHYRHELNHFIHRRVDNPMDAEDILQDVLIKAYRKQYQLTDGNKLWAWLYQIARNAITDYHRASPEWQVSLEESSPLLITFEETGEAENNSAALMACMLCLIEELPEKYRAALVASDFQEIPQHLLGQQLGLSYSAIKSRVQRGREKLRQSIEMRCGSEINQYQEIACCSSKTQMGGCVA